MSWLEGVAGEQIEISGRDRTGKPLRTIIDMNTGLVRNDPIPTDAELEAFYSNSYRIAYKGTARPRPRQVLRNFRRSAQFARQFYWMLRGRHHALDCGAGSGELLYLVTQLGMECIGVEPNVEYAVYCREELGLDVRTEALSPNLFSNRTFDLITLVHVLEHLNDPIKYLLMIREWMSEESVLYVEVPDIEHMCRYHNTGNMFHYGHVYNFNHWTLRAVARIAGLTEIPRSASACHGQTKVFLKKCRPHLGKLENRQNASAVKSLIGKHYAREYRKGKLTKPFVKVYNHLEETVSSANKSSRQIGDNVASVLRADILACSGNS